MKHRCLGDTTPRNKQAGLFLAAVGQRKNMTHFTSPPSLPMLSSVRAAQSLVNAAHTERRDKKRDPALDHIIRYNQSVELGPQATY